MVLMQHPSRQNNRMIYEVAMPQIFRCKDGLFLLFSFFFFWLFSGSAFADWPAIAPEDLRMTDLEEHKGAPAVILLRDELADDLNNCYSVYRRIKILTDAGRHYADVEIPYSRRQFAVEGVSGRTVHLDGTIIPFDGKVFDKIIVKGKRGHGPEIRVHVKSFTLPDVQVGSILDYRFTLRYHDTAVSFPEWAVQLNIPQKRASFKYIPYSGDVILPHGRIGRGNAWTSYLPMDAKPQWHSVPNASTANIHNIDQYIDLNLKSIPPIIEEPYMPPADMLRYRVQFYYTVGRTPEERTPNVYWREEGKFWSRDADNFLDRKKGIDQAVAKAVLPGDSPEQKVRKIYALVAGIPAWLMWVASRDETFFQPDLMSTQQLDAEIAIVELGGKDVFFDPGTKFCPYGLLDWRYSGSKGLRLSASRGTEIAETPVSDYSQAQILRQARLQMTEEGKAEGSVKIGFYGIEAMERRQKAQLTDAEGRKKMLEDEVRGWLPNDSEVTLVGPPNWDDTESHLATEFRISSPLAITAGKRWLIPVHIFQAANKPVFSASKRVNPIYFWYLSREIDEVHITLPSSRELESLPASDDVRLDYAVYRTNQKQESGNSIMAHRDLVMGGMAFPPSMYKELKGFYDKVKVADDQQMIVRGSAHAEVK